MSTDENDLLLRHIDTVSSQIIQLGQNLGQRLDELGRKLERLDEQYIKIKEESGRIDERIKNLEIDIKEHKALIDMTFSKNRQVADAVSKINLKIAYWSGGFAVVLFLLNQLFSKVSFPK